MPPVVLHSTASSHQAVNVLQIFTPPNLHSLTTPNASLQVTSSHLQSFSKASFYLRSSCHKSFISPHILTPTKLHFTFHSQIKKALFHILWGKVIIIIIIITFVLQSLRSNSFLQYPMHRGNCMHCYVVCCLCIHSVTMSISIRFCS